MVWDGNLFLTILVSPLIARAAWITIWVATVAQAIGVAIGIAVAPTLMARAWPVRIPAWTYLWIFRGTPLLAQILFFYAVLPQFGLRLGIIETGLLALGVNEGARMTEIMRAGLGAVGREQREAAYSLGLTRFKTFILVVLPQAVRIILPPTVNNYSYMIKATSLLSVISFSEILRTSQQLAQSTTRPLEVYCVAAIWYLAIISLVTIGQKLMEHRLARSDANRSARGQDAAPTPAAVLAVPAAQAGRRDDDLEARPVVLAGHGLSKQLGATRALFDASLSIRRGEVVVVLGRSGSGKSTLLRCLNRLEVPDAGSVFLEGELFGERQLPDGTLKPVPEREMLRQRRRIGMVFQRFHLFPHLTALENVAVAPKRVLGIRPEDAESKARAVLKRLGLADKADAYPVELSGGQRQRVAIARALAMDPILLLFDEPTSSLDPETVKEFLDAMQKLAADGTTMLIVSHEVGFARAVANRVIVMDAGHIVEEGPVNEVLDAPRNPRTRSFLAAISHAPAAC